MDTVQGATIKISQHNNRDFSEMRD